MWIIFISKCIICGISTFCYSFLLELPKKIRGAAAIIGGAGYGIYFLIVSFYGSNVMACFFGALVISSMSEIVARCMKHTVTSFVTVAVISLVPGLGLYETMFNLVRGSYAEAAGHGGNTMLCMGAIAMAIAISAISFKCVCHKNFLKKLLPSSTNPKDKRGFL